MHVETGKMEKLKVSELMTANVICVRPEENLATARELMLDNRIRHLPVVERGTLVGLLCQHDLASSDTLPLAEWNQLMGAMRVREVMTTEPDTVDPNETVEEAGRRMLEAKYGCLPVTEGDRIVGMLTEADFVRAVVESQAERAA